MAVQDGLRELFQAQGFRCDALHVRAVCLENRARALAMDRRWVQAAFTLVAPPSGGAERAASSGANGVRRPCARPCGSAAERRAAAGSGAGTAAEDSGSANISTAAEAEATGRGSAGGGEAAASRSSAAAVAGSCEARTSCGERAHGSARGGDGGVEAPADLSPGVRGAADGDAAARNGPSAASAESSGAGAFPAECDQSLVWRLDGAVDAPADPSLGVGRAADGDAAARSDSSTASEEGSAAGIFPAEWDQGQAEGGERFGEAADGHSLAALFDGGAPEEVEELVRPRPAATSLSRPFGLCKGIKCSSMLIG